MPELPDVERFKTYLGDTAFHQEIAAVEVSDENALKGVSPKTFRQTLQGRAFASADRHGKFLFVHLQTPPLLVLHFGMTGYLDYNQQEYDPPEHTRVLFRFVTANRLAYVCQRKLGMVALAEDQDAFIEQHELGPDAMDETLTPRAFCERLAGRRGTVKSILMNQETVAGLGNVYADEVLFQAGIAPGHRVDELDDQTLRKLYQTMRRVLKTAIRNNADVSRLPRGYLLRQRAPDGHCPRCGRAVKKAKISGRGTYFCDHCQR
ncbi:MAG: Fpg/Nei family DNA glycosylase [Planctomycetota bacterium]